MVYKGLAADEMPRVPEFFFEDVDRKLSFPGKMFEYTPVEGDYLNTGIGIRTHEELDEINIERAKYLLNMDEALMEMHS
ncbi:Uncharacterised protein [uncultured archaeon]|nr:Uncharacterised protein [uncultured archaeon]